MRAGVNVGRLCVDGEEVQSLVKRNVLEGKSHLATAPQPQPHTWHLRKVEVQRWSEDAVVRT